MGNRLDDVMLWALICAAYHLEKLDSEDEKLQLAAIRKLLSQYSPATVSLYFLRAALAFDPPDTLEQAQALYEHYGVDSSGLEKRYKPAKPQ